MLIEAYATFISRENKKREFPKLVIAGPGIESDYAEKIKQLAFVSHGLQDSIFFTGMLLGDAKWGAFYECEAFVLPSHQENFGIAVVEALACHKPVLISNQVNIWKEIKETGSGIIADDSNKGTLELLKTWTELSEKNKMNMSEKARECYDKYFSITSNMQRFKNFLEYTL